MTKILSQLKELHKRLSDKRDYYKYDAERESNRHRSFNRNDPMIFVTQNRYIEMDNIVEELEEIIILIECKIQ